MKTAVAAVVAAVAVLAVMGCTGSVFAEAVTESESTEAKESAYVLTIPDEVKDLVTVQTDGFDDTTIISVAETASIEAEKALGEENNAAGWIFSISTVTGDELKGMRTGDMSGSEVFAKDEEGNFFLYNHPTDVTFVREQYDDIDDDMKQFSMICEWAGAKARESFLKENEGLTPVSFGNTDLDMHLARVAFQEDANYVISTTQFGPLTPDADSAPEALEKLLDGSHFRYADVEEAPDGEYVVLLFEDENVRFDFFSAEKNLVREVITVDGEEYGSFFEASFEDENTTAADIMQAWYDAVAQEQGLTE